jgi:hypothetical protein
MKKTVAIAVIACLLALNSLFVSKASAAEISLDDAYKAYNTVLTKAGGEKFNLVDINKDGIPELIVDSLQVYTYTTDGVELLYDSWVLCKFYASAESKYLLYYYDWQETSDWSLYEIDSTKKSQDGNSLHFVESFHRNDAAYSHQTIYGEPGVDITLDELKTKLDAKVPHKAEIEMIYTNDEATRAKVFSGQSGEAQAAVKPQIIAEPSASKVLVDGKAVQFQAYAIDGNNYFMLRDIAAVLNKSAKQFEVGFDAKLQSITLTTGKAYTPTGEELAASTDSAKQEAQPTASAIYLNDKEIELVAYNIGGNNYFKLRDLGKAINFGVAWDAANNAIKIQTADVYQEE